MPPHEQAAGATVAQVGVSGPATLKVHLDGKEFDSSYGRGEPMTFMPVQMITAWQEALAMMNPGSTATLLVPSRLAYGKNGYPGFIAPDTPLVFTFECM